MAKRWSYYNTKPCIIAREFSHLITNFASSLTSPTNYSPGLANIVDMSDDGIISHAFVYI